MPIATIIIPPSAGIISRIRLKAIELSANAFMRFSLGTIDDNNDIRAGSCMVQANPINNTKPIMVKVLFWPVMIIIEKIIIKAAWYEYINVSKWRLSNLSLIAPPNGPPSNIGRASRPIIKVVIKGDFVVS